MGKGDKKTKRGKITMGSYGRRRKRKPEKKANAEVKGQKAEAGIKTDVKKKKEADKTTAEKGEAQAKKKQPAK